MTSSMLVLPLLALTLSIAAAAPDAVYTVTHYEDALCSSMQHFFRFKKSAGVLDCYMFVGENSEPMLSSFTLQCDGGAAVYEEFNGSRCEGEVLGHAEMPWSLYTDSECTTWPHVSPTNGSELIFRHAMQGALDPADYPSTCQESSLPEGVYTVAGYESATCGSTSYTYYFKRSAEALDCYVYVGTDGEVGGLLGGWSFSLRCAGGSALYEDFNGSRCEGEVVGRGETPWSWYTNSECATYAHVSFANGSESVFHQAMQGALDPAHYPSTCVKTSHSESTEVSLGSIHAARCWSATLLAVVLLSAA